MNTISEPDWASLRSRFPVVERRTYLNTGTFGPLPRDALDTMTEIVRDEIETGRAGGEYFERISEARTSLGQRLARLLGAAPADMVLTNATTHGAQLVCAGLRLGASDEVVTTDMEHHSFTTVLRATRARVRVASIRSADNAEKVVESIKTEMSDRTRLIAVSHVSWIDGRVLPIGPLADLGVPVLVDGAQSVGAISVDVGALGCEFLVFPCQKWLLGPDATGGVYVHPGWHERLDVALPSYYGHEPYSGNMVDTPGGAQRFSPGTIALSALAPLDASLELAERVGPARFERAARLTGHFRAALQDRFEVVTGPGQSTLLSFNPGRDAAIVAGELEARNVVVRTVAPDNWLRVSVGFWNNEADCDALLNALE